MATDPYAVANASIATSNAAINTASPNANSGYTPPPDFKSRRDAYTNAFDNANDRLNALTNAAYTKAGFVGLTKDLDPSAQYGDIQQMLHDQGQQLQADDAVEEHRGLGVDSGLAGQRARLINYTTGATRSNYGVAFDSNQADLGAQGVQAKQDELAGIQGVASDKAQWDGTTNYDNWLASQAAPAANTDPAANPASLTTPYTAWGAPNTGTGPGGYNPLAPQNASINGVAKKPAAKKKAAVGIHAQ